MRQSSIPMARDWSQSKDQWLEETSLPRELASWALKAINPFEKEINSYSSYLLKNEREQDYSKLKALKKEIKANLTLKENSLDDISLNTSNSYKLQISVPSNLNYLMKSWAAAEGRDLSSIALQCLEIGLREMKSNGGIPNAAIKRYDIACEKRIALAEVNKTLEKHEEEMLSKNKFIS